MCREKYGRTGDARHVSEKYVSDNKRLFIPDGDLVAYVQNRYVATGETLGTYGFSAKKE